MPDRPAQGARLAATPAAHDLNAGLSCCRPPGDAGDPFGGSVEVPDLQAAIDREDARRDAVEYPQRMCMRKDLIGRKLHAMIGSVLMRVLLEHIDSSADAQAVHKPFSSCLGDSVRVGGDGAAMANAFAENVYTKGLLKKPLCRVVLVAGFPSDVAESPCIIGIDGVEEGVPESGPEHAYPP